MLGLGKNQQIAVAGNLLIFGASYVLVWFDKLSAEFWVGAAVAAVSYVITQGRLANKTKAAE